MPALRSRTVGRFLTERGVRQEGPEWDRFIAPRLGQLTRPDAMVDRARAVSRLARAVEQGETVVVFGDYDCDGMTSTAILSEGLRRLGARRVVPLLASRFGGGYGLSGPALERVLAADPGLVVTCDCGSSDHATLRLIRERAIDAIVIDHHLVPDEPLPAYAFLNPHRPECGFPYKGLASCGLALSVLAGVRAELGKTLDVRDWLDLVAIGTIADVAPLTEDNRVLTRAGLALLADVQRPGLRALFDLIGIESGRRLGASDVAFRIAPRLNAPGRLGSPEVVLELLLAEDITRARDLAAEVESQCQTRRLEQEKILVQVGALLEGHAGSTSGLVLGEEGWNHGIVGIVAGRVADQKKVPTVVIGFEDGIGRGSVRGPAGFPLFDAVSACQKHLTRFGGHQAALGLEIRRENLEAFREQFVAFCEQCTNYERVVAPPPLALSEGDRLRDVFDDLCLLEPCGEGNPKPTLEFEGSVVTARSVKGAHLKLELRLGSGECVNAFGPGLGALADTLSGRVRLVGELGENHFNGRTTIELLVREAPLAL